MARYISSVFIFIFIIAKIIYPYVFVFFLFFCFFKLQTSIKKHTRKIKTPHGNSEFFPWLGVPLVVQAVKNLPATQETWVQYLDWEGPLEKEMATHSSILAWKIPWTK